ncbi:hypothetical protein BsWGS_19434 [Bradybaena similaris]
MSEPPHRASQELTTEACGSTSMVTGAAPCDTAFPKEVTQTIPKLSILSAVAYLQDARRIVSSNSYSGIQDMKVSFNCHQPKSHYLNLAGIESCLTFLTLDVVFQYKSLDVFQKMYGRPIVFPRVDYPPHYTSITRQKLPKMQQSINTVVEISQDILRLINFLVEHNRIDDENFRHFADLEGFVLDFLTDLGQLVEKICAATFMRTVEEVKLATTELGIIGKHLGQNELHTHAITLLSPLWPPFSETKELLPYITYHEQLCESYLATGKLQEAWKVGWEATNIDISLLSEPVVNVLCCLLVKLEPLLNKTECLHQFKSMAVLLDHPVFDDVLVIGTFLYWETAICKEKLNIDIFKSKTTYCLEIWTQWFQSVGNGFFNAVGTPRTNLSFIFLRKFTELAIANFQNAIAVKTACEAYRLAHKMEQWSVVKDMTQIIVTLTPQLGLQIAPATLCEDQENTDTFMVSLGLGKDSGLLSLVAIATHHFKTGQFQKFLHVRDAVYSHISLHQTDDVELVVQFSQAVIKRLEAEFIMLPSFTSLDEKNDSTKPFSHALCMAFSSFKCINAIYEKLGVNLPRDQDNVLGLWQIVHELLCAAKLIGELSSYIGEISRGRHYFQFGLKAARKFKLANWATIFYSRLIEQELVYHDLKQATDKLQETQRFLKCRMSSSERCLQHGHEKPSIDIISSNELLCGFKMTKWEREDTSCSCQQKSYEREKTLSDLFDLPAPDSSNMKEQGTDLDYLILTDIRGCCSCCQSEMVASCINIMCIQAEIFWRKDKSIYSVSSLLQRSLHMSEMFAKMSPCASLKDFITDIGFNVSYLGQNVKSSNRVLSETAYRCAEIYFQNLYLTPADTQMSCDHVVPDIEHILSLLNTAETAGRMTGGFHMCNAIVASALLLKNSMNYLTVLQTSSTDDEQDSETSPDIVFDIITSTLLQLSVKEDDSKDTVCESKKQSDDNKESLSERKEQSDYSKEYVWGNKQQSYINLLGHRCSEPVSTEEKSASGGGIDGRVFMSYSDVIGKSLMLKTLTDKFPSMSACQKVAERKSMLQNALQQICEFPHYWLYRQISQALAICLWEKQMVDAWGTKQACSLQVDIATHLTDSMHITFQQTMHYEFCLKLW